MSPQPHVAVTGASGFIGRTLVSRLGGRGPVSALYRRAGQIPAPTAGEVVRPVLGALHDPAELAELCLGTDYVVHCAATMSKSDRELSERVNVRGTELVARAAAEAGARRFVYVSSISVLGATRSPGGLLTEADEPTGLGRLNAYARTKYAGELAVRRVAAETGLEYTIVRPTNVYGAGSVPWFQMYERLVGRVPVAFGRVEVDVVHVSDVVDALIACTASPDAVNEAFHIGHEMVELARFIEGVAGVVGRETWRLPRALDGLLRFIVDRGYALVTGGRLSLSLTAPVSYPHGKATRAFGYAPIVDLEEGMSGLRSWYRARCLAEARVDPGHAADPASRSTRGRPHHERVMEATCQTETKR